MNCIHLFERYFYRKCCIFKQNAFFLMRIETGDSVGGMIHVTRTYILSVLCLLLSCELHIIHLKFYIEEQKRFRLSESHVLVSKCFFHKVYYWSPDNTHLHMYLHILALCFIKIHKSLKMLLIVHVLVICHLQGDRQT